mmetsp:Transcript_5945/g.20332  ORF Transcript_5945/g.20332 Transcript_5945/m.20332 type:complete len:101 (+) Transcript_5945:39-341(+)
MKLSLFALFAGSAAAFAPQRAAPRSVAMRSDLEGRIDKIAADAKTMLDDKIKTTGGAGAPSAAGTPVAAAGGAGVDELVKNLKDKSEQLAKEIKAEIGKN